MSVDLGNREKWIARHYAERNAASDGRLNEWGNVIFNGKLIDGYFSEALIDYIFTQQIANTLPVSGECLIADFGCGSGHVSNRVASQLTKPERPVVPIGIDKFDENFWRRGKPDFDIETVVEGNLLKLPIKENAFHAGILRYVLPFIHENDQLLALEQIYRVLKPGAVLVVLNSGVFNQTEKDKSWNKLYEECCAFNGLHNMHHPSCESLIDMATINVKFHVKHKEELTDIAFGYLSAQICSRAYNLNKEDRKKLKTLFEEWKQKEVLPFEPAFIRPMPSSLRVPWPRYLIVLQKPLSP